MLQAAYVCKVEVLQGSTYAAHLQDFAFLCLLDKLLRVKHFALPPGKWKWALQAHMFRCTGVLNLLNI